MRKIIIMFKEEYIQLINKYQQLKGKAKLLLVLSILFFVLFLVSIGQVIVGPLVLFDAVYFYVLAIASLILCGIFYLSFYRDIISASGFANNEQVVEFQLKISVVNLFVALGVMLITFLIFASQWKESNQSQQAIVSQWEASNHSQREIVNKLQRQIEVLQLINNKQK